MPLPYRRILIVSLYSASALILCLAIWGIPSRVSGRTHARTDGPIVRRNPPPLPRGDARAGRDIFRFETFGDEGFWTDAVRMPQGMKQARVTLLDALKTGLNIDADRIDPALRESLAAELKTDHSFQNAPLLNDPKTLTRLVGSNAVIGIISRNGKVGVACALCHTITDASVYAMPGKGSIGHRIDGPTPHNLNMGRLLALGANSRAIYPTLQFGPPGKTVGRAPRGLPDDPTEAQVDAYLRNPNYYPVGTFDDTPDGNGNSIHIQPLFRQDLAAPYGSSGQDARLEDFSNTAYTVLFDMTTLTTPAGRAFLKAAGGAAGIKLANNYAHILKETGVTGYPYIHARKMGKPGSESATVGLRVDEKKLLDLNAYLASLPAPRGVVTNRAAVLRGRDLFRSDCTSCHNVDQGKPVPYMLVPMKRIFPGYRPTVIARRKPPLSPIQNSPGTFDDKMVVVDASGRGDIRGDALPLLLDLARKPAFLHDDSVHSLTALLDPRRGGSAPHPFYVRSASRRADMVAFLRSLDTRR